MKKLLFIIPLSLALSVSTAYAQSAADYMNKLNANSLNKMQAVPAAPALSKSGPLSGAPSNSAKVDPVGNNGGAVTSSSIGHGLGLGRGLGHIPPKLQNHPDLLPKLEAALLKLKEMEAKAQNPKVKERLAKRIKKLEKIIAEIKVKVSQSSVPQTPVVP